MMWKNSTRFAEGVCLRHKEMACPSCLAYDNNDLRALAGKLLAIADGLRAQLDDTGPRECPFCEWNEWVGKHQEGCRLLSVIDSATVAGIKPSS